MAYQSCVCMRMCNTKYCTLEVASKPKPCSSETKALDIPEVSYTLQNIRHINFPVYTMYGMLWLCK